MQSAHTWDIFCTVVDNYGDAGVCWRLARQLAAEHGLRVRLWVDRLDTLARICPGIDAAAVAQSRRGVEIRRWAEPFAPVEPGDVVVEALACELPEAFVAAMAARRPRPGWINLEYLSAEDWVGECHGLASPSPRWPLTKHFFFPGFTPASGGLAVERGLLQARRAFRADARAVAAFWRSLGLAPARVDEMRVSLFCYANEAIPGLFAAWAEGAAPVTCLVPEGVAVRETRAFFGEAAAGSVLRKGSLEVRILPFLEQEGYDRLLWACDGNFVRGEDSFVRAQWAARPFVWQIYPQEEDAHWHKLAAFLRLYGQGLPAEAAAALSTLWTAWNGGAGAGQAWPAFWRQRALLERHGELWCARLLQNGDLATNLVEFCRNRL